MVDVVGLRFVAEGQSEAVAAIKAYDAAQSKLTREIVAGAARIQNVSSTWDRLNKLVQQGTITAGAHKDAQIRLAREYAVLNGMVTASGAINTRKAQAELRAAQATRDSAAAAKAKEKAVAQEARAQEQAAARALVAQRQRDAEERRLYQNYLRYQRDKEQAALNEARERERAAQQITRAAEEEARAQQRVRVETEMLARAYNPLMAATMAYETQVEQLNRAHALGVLSADQLEAKLSELGIAYASVGTNATRANNFVNQFGAVTQIAGVKTNRFGMVAQQVGYQVGDFFVQVQSGTNAFVAFGQQATQLAGLLPGLAGAIVGIGISVGTMFLAMWDRSRRATEGVDDLKDAMDALRAAAQSAEVDLARMQFGLGSADEARAALEMISLTQQLAAARAEYAEASAAAAANEASLSAAGAAGRAAQQLQEIQGRVDALQDEIDAYQEKARLLAAEEARLAGIQSFYDQRADQAEAENERAAAVERITQAIEAEKNAILDQLTLAARANEYGQDSAEYRQAALDIEEQVYRQQLAQSGILGNNQNLLVAMWREMRNVEIAANGVRNAVAGIPSHLRDAIAAANQLASALANARAQTAGIGMSTEGTLAEIEALEQGMTQAEARATGAAAALRAELTAAYSAGVTSIDQAIQQGAVLEDQVQRRYEAVLLEEQANERRAELYRQIADAAKADEGGGGSGATQEELANLQKFVDEMQTRIDQERILIGLYGQARREREIYFELIKQLEEAEVSYNAQAVADAARRLAAEEEVNRKMQERQDQVEQLADDLSGAFADFFESGFRDFDGFTESILGAFQKMVVDMVATAAKNRIMFAMGAGPAPGPDIFSSIGSMFSGGGLSGLAGATGALGGLGSAIGALAGPVGIAVGLFSIFRRRRESDNKAEKKEADERYRLETRLLELQGKTRALREREIAALQPGNRALGRRIQRLEEEARIAAERDSLELQLLEVQGNIAELRRRELAALDESNRALQKEIWALQDAAEAAAERADLEKQLLQVQGDTAALRKMELEQLDAANRALQKEIWALEDAAAIADERADLERQLLEAQGDTAALRALELEALDESNRALQEQIWALEDQAAAAEEAARIADERTSLERQLLELQGDTDALRAMDLAALDASNQALQIQIWALEDQAAAAEEAARVADERAGLERQLLELQGDTNALRQLDLAALDASNRALQMQIWALEDLQRALEGIDMNDFVSLVDYNRAVAQANLGLSSAANVSTPPSVSTIPTPPVTNSTPSTTSGASTGAGSAGLTDVEVRDAVRYLTDITQQLLTKIDNNTRRSSNVLTTWDEDGIPPERAA